MNRKKLLFLILLSISLFSLNINVLSQIDDPVNVDEEVLIGQKAFVDILPESDTGFSKQKSSSLAQSVKVQAADKSLTEILSLLSKLCNVNFVYDDQLMDIKGLDINCTNEKLYEVLDALLDPFNISYYEFEPGKIALAKRKKIDEKTGAINGIIKDESGERLIGANVLIKELAIGGATDTKGYYSIRNIKPGEYTLEASFVGYEKQSRKVKIKAGEILEINFTLKSSAFQIGGIEVVGTTELLPKDVNTKTVIQSGEIEHYQASSLKDVLDLVPGVQKTDNPGLDKTTQVAIRGSESDQLNSFGTMIIVDGSPLSNNANLQFEKLTGSKFGSSNVGGGIDLRTIPADNIESIEVITGLPSVRYGDVTAGIINVQTKIGPVPNRLKLKNNPATQEANLGGGFLIGESGLSYNLNVARSERDIRLTGDEYTRLTGQAVYSNNLFDNQLNINNKINFQRVFDEEEPQGDQQQTKNYNRSYTLGFSTWGKYKPAYGVSSLDFNLFVNMDRQNSMKSKLIQSDLRVLPNGDTVSSYIGKVETKGIEWTIGGRLEWNRIFYTGEFIHKFLVGTNPEYNANTGVGLIVDSLYNYYGAQSGRRSYSFDDIPGQFLMNIYAEDKITGNFLYDFNLTLGMRYEMYRPKSFNLSGLWGDGQLVESYQGTFFNPRLNLMVYLSDVNQVRLSAGTSSKSPAMATVYPPGTVFTWRNPIDSVTYYFNYDRQVPNLKGYKETQYEISYDHKFFDIIGTSISAYYKKRSGEPTSQTVPVFYSQTVGERTYVYLIDTYSLSKNTGWTESKGIEFTLRTAKIKPLNMEFQIVGAYNYRKSSSANLSYSSTPDSTLGQYPNYLVPNVPIDTLIGMVYPAGDSWGDSFQLNYYIKYTCAPLGLWVTLRAEQLIWEKSQNRNQSPRDLSILSESSLADYLFSTAVKTKPNKWLLNLNVSKSLFPGAEVSFYVNNFLDDSATRQYYINATTISEESRNPSLSYGIEFSMIIDNLFRKDK